MQLFCVEWGICDKPCDVVWRNAGLVLTVEVWGSGDTGGGAEEFRTGQ